jgi:phosphatidylserine/phosphatidylglycerophosphate/cardiolipin synthase-like enzyme
MCLILTLNAGAQKNISKYIKVYFTQPVDTSFSNGVHATYLNNIIFDTLAAYINRAKYTIDIAQYEYETYTGDPIYTAINNAYSRGVKIRFIEDSSYTAKNTGVAKLNAAIPVIHSPGGSKYNIMHNKFVIIDENGPDTNNAIVWTGSPDWDQDMSLGDYNNVIIFQSKVLAGAFTHEFDIMWGDTTHGGPSNAAKRLFGQFKPNSGAHYFNIGGSEVELYFSPSDSTNNHIVDVINSATTDLYCGMFTFSETTDANDIVNQKNAGAYAAAILDSYSSSSYSTFKTILPGGLGSNFVPYVSGTYLYHNKYVVADPSAACSDPTVLTGSHNWTATANSMNDENTVIVHNDTIANLYLQAFAGDFKAISGNPLIKQPGCAATFSINAVANNGTSECAKTGKATVTASGGTPPYTYSWAPGGGTNSTATGLSAGTYTITVKDDNSHTATASVTITVPANVTASAVVNANASECASTGKATVTAGGGTTPYTYNWTGGNTNAVASGLSAGSYTVTVKDNNGCSATASITITAPANVTASAVVNANASECASTGKATVTAGGGTTPYSYSWTGGNTNAVASGLSAGSYTVTVKDNNGCSATASITITAPANVTASAVVNANASECASTGKATVTAGGGTTPYTYSWTGGSTNAVASGLSAGSYTVTVKDNNGCSATASITITAPANITASAVVNANASECASTGKATVTAGGGTTPYTYSWTGGNTNAVASGLSAGSYTVTVKDNNGCSATASIAITAPATISISASITASVSCYGGDNGSASSGVSGGTSPYAYFWSGGGGTNSYATGLSAGTYTVMVKDTNGCSATATATVSQPATSVLVSTSPIVNVLCMGGNNGSISSATTGGTAPYTYLWSDANTQTSAIATALTAGTYTITVNDSNGCTSSASASVTEPPALMLTCSAADSVICSGGCTSINAIGGGGTPAYTYLWNTGATTTSINVCPVVKTTYTVTLTDANGCTHDTAVDVNVNPCLGVSEAISLNEEVRFYPNPFSQSINADINIDGPVTLSIFNMVGQEIGVWQVDRGSNTINTGTISPGIYIIQVKTSNGILNKKLVKVN